MQCVEIFCMSFALQPEAFETEQKQTWTRNRWGDSLHSLLGMRQSTEAIGEKQFVYFVGGGALQFSSC